MNEEVFAKRFPFTIFVLVSALLFLSFVFIWPTGLTYEASSLPFLVVLFFLVIYAGVWTAVFRVRLKAVGLPHSRWASTLYGLFVYIAYFFLSYYVSKGRFLAPGLFVLLNMPLVILKEKSSVPDAPPLTGQ